jgi:hypothetical protein
MDLPERHISNPIQLIRADRYGYSYAGEWVDGFADRPELSVECRVQLARLAERCTPDLSGAQQQLLASPAAKRILARRSSVELEGF